MPSRCKGMLPIKVTCPECMKERGVFQLPPRASFQNRFKSGACEEGPYPGVSSQVVYGATKRGGGEIRVDDKDLEQRCRSQVTHLTWQRSLPRPMRSVGIGVSTLPYRDRQVSPGSSMTMGSSPFCDGRLSGETSGSHTNSWGNRTPC